MTIRYSIRTLGATGIAALILTVFAHCGLAQGFSESNVGATSADFLTMGVGARASALGGAFVAVSDDATAGYWNPAGLMQISAAELVFMHNSWYQDIKNEYLVLALPLSRSFTLGFGVSYLDYGSFEGYSVDDEPTGAYSANASVLSSSGALKIGSHLSLGVTAKMLSEKLERSSATGYAIDVGWLYRASAFSFGLNLRNMGKGLRYLKDEFPLPRQLLMGLAVSLYENRLTVASDLEIPSDRGVLLHHGFEYCYESTVFLRSGYSHQFGCARPCGSGGMSFGFGVRHSFGAVDYSYRPDDRMGDTHQISLRLSLRDIE